MLIRIREFITEEEFKSLEKKAHTDQSDYLSNLAELSRLRRKSPFLFFETGRATLDLGQPRPLVAPLDISGTSDELLARIILLYPDGRIRPLLWRKKKQREHATEILIGDSLDWPQKGTLPGWKFKWFETVQPFWEPFLDSQTAVRLKLFYPYHENGNDFTLVEELVWAGFDPKCFTKKREVFRFTKDEITIPPKGVDHVEIKKDCVVVGADSSSISFPFPDGTRPGQYRRFVFHSTADSSKKFLYMAGSSPDLIWCDTSDQSRKFHKMPHHISNKACVESMAIIKTQEEGLLVLVMSSMDQQLSLLEIHDGGFGEFDSFQLPFIARHFVSRDKDLLIFTATGYMHAARVRTRQEAKKVWTSILQRAGIERSMGRKSFLERHLPNWGMKFTMQNDHAFSFLIHEVIASCLDQEQESICSTALNDLRWFLDWLKQNKRQYPLLHSRAVRLLLEAIIRYLPRLLKDEITTDFLTILQECLQYCATQSQETSKQIFNQEFPFFYRLLLNKLHDHQKEQWDNCAKLIRELLGVLSTPAASTHQPRNTKGITSIDGMVTGIIPWKKDGLAAWSPNGSLIFLNEFNYCQYVYELNWKASPLNWKGMLTGVVPIVLKILKKENQLHLLFTSRQEAAILDLENPTNMKILQDISEFLVQENIFPEYGLWNEENGTILLGGQTSDAKAVVIEMIEDKNSGSIFFKKGCIWRSETPGKIVRLVLSESHIYALDSKVKLLYRCGRFLRHHGKQETLEFQKCLHLLAQPTSMAVKKKITKEHLASTIKPIGCTLLIGDTHGLLQAIDEDSLHETISNPTTKKPFSPILDWLFRCPGTIYNLTVLPDGGLVVASDMDCLFQLDESGRFLEVPGNIGPIKSLLQRGEDVITGALNGRIWQVSFQKKDRTYTARIPFNDERDLELYLLANHRRLRSCFETAGFERITQWIDKLWEPDDKECRMPLNHFFAEYIAEKCFENLNDQEWEWCKGWIQNCHIMVASTFIRSLRDSIVTSSRERPSERFGERLADLANILFKRLNRMAGGENIGTPIREPWSQVWIPLLETMWELVLEHPAGDHGNRFLSHAIPGSDRDIKNFLRDNIWQANAMEFSDAFHSFKEFLRYYLALLMKKDLNDQKPFSAFNEWWDRVVNLFDGNELAAYKNWQEIRNDYRKIFGTASFFCEEFHQLLHVLFTFENYEAKVQPGSDGIVKWWSGYKTIAEKTDKDLTSIFEIVVWLLPNQDQQGCPGAYHFEKLKDSPSNFCEWLRAAAEVKKNFDRHSGSTKLKDRHHVLKEIKKVFQEELKSLIPAFTALERKIATYLKKSWESEIPSIEFEMACNYNKIKEKEILEARLTGQSYDPANDRHILHIELRNHWIFPIRFKLQGETYDLPEFDPKQIPLSTKLKLSPDLVAKGTYEQNLQILQIYEDVPDHKNVIISFPLQGNIIWWVKEAKLPDFLGGELIKAVRKNRKLLLQFTGIKLNQFHITSLVATLEKYHDYGKNEYLIIHPRKSIDEEIIFSLDSEWHWFPLDLREEDNLVELAYAFHGPESPRFSIISATLALLALGDEQDVHIFWKDMVSYEYIEQVKQRFWPAIPTDIQEALVKKAASLSSDPFWLFGEHGDLPLGALLDSEMFSAMERHMASQKKPGSSVLELSSEAWLDIVKRKERLWDIPLSRDKIEKLFSERLQFRSNNNESHETFTLLAGSLQTRFRHFYQVYIIIPAPIDRTTNEVFDREIARFIEERNAEKPGLWLFYTADEALTYMPRPFPSDALWADFSSRHLFYLISWEEPERVFNWRLLFRSESHLEDMNPFHPSNGMGGSITLFAGREKELARIQQTVVVKGQGILIFGPRRIGKTSLLEKVQYDWKEKVENDEILELIFLDFSEIDPRETDATGLFFSRLQDGLSKHSFPVPYPTTTRQDDWVPWLRRITGNGQKPLILLMDEADKLFKNDQIIPQLPITHSCWPLFSWLRSLSLASAGKLLRVIAVSYQHGSQSRLAMNNALYDSRTPLYNWLEGLELKAWDPKHAKKFLTNTLQNLGIFLPEAVINLLWKKSMNLPWILQELGAEILQELGAQPASERWLSIEKAEKITTRTLMEQSRVIKTTVENAACHIFEIRTKEHGDRPDFQALKSHFWPLLREFALERQKEQWRGAKLPNAFHVSELSSFMKENAEGRRIGDRNIKEILGHLDRTVVLRGLEHSYYQFAYGLLPKITEYLEGKN